MKKHIPRVIIYLVIIVVAIVFVQKHKKEVISSRNKETVSIPNQRIKYGYPVDVERIQKRELYKGLRITLLPESQSNNRYQFLLSRKESQKIKKNQKVRSLKKGEVIGTVVDVNNRADLDTGLYKGTLKLNSQPDESNIDLRTVDITTETIKNAVSVPLDAIDTSFKAGEKYVWLRKEDKATPVPVKAGIYGQSRVEITEGIAQGDEVIVNGHRLLDSGMSLRVRKCINCSETEKEAKL